MAPYHRFAVTQRVPWCSGVSDGSAAAYFRRGPTRGYPWYPRSRTCVEFRRCSFERASSLGTSQKSRTAHAPHDNSPQSPHVYAADAQGPQGFQGKSEHQAKPADTVPRDQQPRHRSPPAATAGQHILRTWENGIRCGSAKTIKRAGTRPLRGGGGRLRGSSTSQDVQSPGVQGTSLTFCFPLNTAGSLTI